MVEQKTVRNEASTIAAGARRTRDLTDAESECVRGLLASDEAFGALVTAQQNAILVDADDHGLDEETERLATDAAGKLADAIDRRIDVQVAVAKDVVAFADEVDALSWGVAIDPYQAGFTTVTDLQRATRPELVNAGMNPKLVDRVKDEVGDFVEGEA
ncbi:hypothetical protein NDI85_21275 [Halomicroarcula sp. S1AR25-4]|uniref:hypothetical protein n=1 Tax=Haloarcula sp. S1AR25-4 TaxID=2950538 RepID=UPI0028757206|nr:hypothetical protein [Halomicroarcula sp. S1AR25-4]MDS0280320.1 hypothetical protein [Halomicroarcula sp. S1AR25-4]